MQPVEVSLRTAGQHLAAGRSKEALSVLDEALASRPGYPPLVSLKAVALMRDGQGEAAVRQAEAALAPQPDWPDGLANLGYVLFGLGRASEAERALRRALDKDRTHEASTLTLGHILARSGRARILIDLSRVGFVDSSGLSVLVTALKAARAAGGDVAVLRPAAQARALLELTRLHEVMTVFEDETTAVETLLAS